MEEITLNAKMKMKLMNISTFNDINRYIAWISWVKPRYFYLSSLFQLTNASYNPQITSFVLYVLVGLVDIIL